MLIVSIIENLSRLTLLMADRFRATFCVRQGWRLLDAGIPNAADCVTVAL